MAWLLTVAVYPSQWEDTTPHGDGAINAVLGHGADWGLSFPMILPGQEVVANPCLSP